MTKDAILVVVGFVKLSEQDQQDVIDKISEFLKSNKYDKLSVRESWEKQGRVVLGPSGISCPCCGR